MLSFRRYFKIPCELLLLKIAPVGATSLSLRERVRDTSDSGPNQANHIHDGKHTVVEFTVFHEGSDSSRSSKPAVSDGRLPYSRGTSENPVIILHSSVRQSVINICFNRTRSGSLKAFTALGCFGRCNASTLNGFSR